MSYKVETAYSTKTPSSPKNAIPFRLFACHTTEGNQGRTGALATLKFLQDNPTRNASYHELWYYHEAQDEFGVIRIVQPNRAAHSVNPNPPPGGPYQPTKWVQDSLGTAWRDPNQGIYAISIAGRVADADRYSKNPRFIQHALRRLRELQKELGNGIERLAEHAQFQPSNRTDWGKQLTPALGGPTIPKEGDEDMYLTKAKAVEPFQLQVGPGTNLRPAPTLSSTPYETPDSRWVTVVAETTGDTFANSNKWWVFLANETAFKYVHVSQEVARKALGGDISAIETKLKAAEAALAAEKTKSSQLQGRLTQIKTLAT